MISKGMLSQQSPVVWRSALLGAALMLSGYATTALAASSWATTETRVHPTQNAVLKGYLAPSETLEITVALKLRNRDELERMTELLRKPGNPAYAQWMTPEQIRAQYEPTEQQAQSVADYLRLNGFTNISVSSNHLLVTATGRASSVRNAFNTELAHFSRDGKEGIATVKDVQVPADLSGTVLSVLGLQTLDQVHTLAQPAVAPTGSVIPHYPTEFPVIYGASSLPSASNTIVGIISVGDMGQTITDLHTFDSQRSLPTLTPTVVQVGTDSGDTSGTDEWDLDSQDIQAMAGGTLSQLIFYAAQSFSDSDLASAYNTAESGNAKVINVSLGQCETAANSDGSMATDDQIFEMATAKGQTFSVSSGDHGSKECGAGANGSAGSVVGASYPASSPYVIAVGGTTLYTNASDGYSGESVWTYSGGEPSLYEPQPVYQAGIVPGSYRGVPDIAFDGDPASGARIVYNGGAATYAGTSLSSPLFVGAWARIESANNNSVGFPVSYIYGFGATPPASIFNDVTTGSNGDYSATVGWDYASGFGSFNVAQLSSAIANLPVVQLTHKVDGNCPSVEWDFSWNTGTNNPTSYNLYQSKTSNSLSTATLVGSGSAGSTGIVTEPGPTVPGTSYYYWLNACNAFGCGPYTGPVATPYLTPRKPPCP